MEIDRSNIHTISVKRFLTITLRKWYVLILSATFGFFALFIPLKATESKTYYSYGTLIMPAYVANGLPTICDAAKSDEVINKVVEKSICHSNGELLSFSEIKKGISATYSNADSLIVTIKFSNYDFSICEIVTNHLIDETLKLVNENPNYKILNDKVALISHADDYYKEKNNIFLISVTSCFGFLFVTIFIIFVLDKKRPILLNKNDLVIDDRCLYYEMDETNNHIIDDIILNIPYSDANKKLIVFVSSESDGSSTLASNSVHDELQKFDKKSCILYFSNNNERIVSSDKPIVTIESDSKSAKMIYCGDNTNRCLYFASEEFNLFLSKLLNEYDFILFDFGNVFENQDFIEICKKDACLLICGTKGETNVSNLLSVLRFSEKRNATFVGFIIKK